MMLILQCADLVFASGGSSFPVDPPILSPGVKSHRHITHRFVYSDKHNCIPGIHFSSHILKTISFFVAVLLQTKSKLKILVQLWCSEAKVC